MVLACGGLGGGSDTVKLGPDQTPTIEAGPESEGEAAETAGPTEVSVSLNTLWVMTEASGTTVGGTSKATVSVRPAAEQDQLRVGFFEEEVSGIGQQWHSSGWMAVTLASMLLGIDARDYEFSFSTGGRIDGPSAGGLMTVGVLAALRGDGVDPSTRGDIVSLQDEGGWEDLSMPNKYAASRRKDDAHLVHKKASPVRNLMGGQ